MLDSSDNLTLRAENFGWENNSPVLSMNNTWTFQYGSGTASFNIKKVLILIKNATHALGFNGIFIFALFQSSVLSVFLVSIQTYQIPRLP